MKRLKRKGFTGSPMFGQEKDASMQKTLNLVKLKMFFPKIFSFFALIPFFSFSS